MGTGSSYFLYGYFGAGNFGDDVLLYVAIRNILARDPAATFWIRNYGPVNLEKDFPGRVRCTDIEKIHHTNWPFAVKFLILMRSYWIHMGRVSTLVVGGGTLIHDSTALKSTFLLLCLCLVAKIRGRRIVGIGLGLQTMKTIRGKMMVRLMAKLFDRLCLRDQLSFDQFKALSAGSSRMSLTADLAYDLPEDKLPGFSKNKIIAVTLVEYAFQRLEQASRQPAMAALAAVLACFMKEGYQIRLLSLQKERPDLGVTGDTPLLEKLRAEIPLPFLSQIPILALECDSESIERAYDGVCLTVGSRFHSLVFSAIRHIPFVGLTHEPKIVAICDEFSMPCFAVNLWNEEGLTRVIRSGIEKTIDPQTVQHYRRLALDNFEQMSQ